MDFLRPSLLSFSGIHAPLGASFVFIDSGTLRSEIQKFPQFWSDKVIFQDLIFQDLGPQRTSINENNLASSGA